MKPNPAITQRLLEGINNVVDYFGKEGVKNLGAVAAVVITLLLGLNQFRANKDKEIAVKFWEEQAEFFDALLSTVAKLGSERDRAEWLDARDKFWELHHGMAAIHCSSETREILKDIGGVVSELTLLEREMPGELQNMVPPSNSPELYRKLRELNWKLGVQGKRDLRTELWEFEN